jgi:hypothetical protein
MDADHVCAPQTLEYKRLRFLLSRSIDDMVATIVAMVNGDHHGDGSLQDIDPLHRIVIVNQAALMDGAVFHALRSTDTLAWSMFRKSGETIAGCTQLVCDEAAARLCSAVDDWLALEVFPDVEAEAAAAQS